MKLTRTFCDLCGEEIPIPAPRGDLTGTLYKDLSVNETMNLEDICYVCNLIIFQAINTCKEKKKKK